MIDLTINEEVLKKAVERAKEKGIILPTFEQMKDPTKIPQAIKDKLKEVGLWDVNPLNLFRITWKNEPKEKGGTFGKVNYFVMPSEITGVKAKIVALVGKWFPTGAHKVGATYGCLVPRLVTGQFDPTSQKAVWPSTGNYCRGGAYNSQLLGCDSIAILPEGMSRERFEWLKSVAGEIITTPGGESNVKEIFDKSWELKRTREDVVVFNQFEEFGNYLWHHEVTGSAMEEVLAEIMKPEDKYFGVSLTSGSAGTLGSGDYLKKIFPQSKIAVCEAKQCPTLLYNGFGDHRIEGIGDKHVPWIHNVKNTDMIVDIDDEACLRLLRLFNEEAGREYLNSVGVPREVTDNLSLFGISGIANVIGAVKMAKYYDLTEKDVILTVFTDSAEMYLSRVEEMREAEGPYDEQLAEKDLHAYMLSQTTDWMLELSYYDRFRVHNLKYYTWIEQQGKCPDELNAQWYDYENYWENIPKVTPKIDELIEKFNERTGLLKELK